MTPEKLQRIRASVKVAEIAKEGQPQPRFGDVYTDRADLLAEVNRLHAVLDSVRSALWGGNLPLTLRAIRARARLLEAGEAP